MFLYHMLYKFKIIIFNLWKLFYIRSSSFPIWLAEMNSNRMVVTQTGVLKGPKAYLCGFCWS
ncbi:hypothetical protein Avbf_00153 [Armadillidium vulgare]|nr:hypothetical protein Avbf_00153 [Armadillidium vulgare]